jgi:hypothetical protein
VQPARDVACAAEPRVAIVREPSHLAIFPANRAGIPRAVSRGMKTKTSPALRLCIKTNLKAGDPASAPSIDTLTKITRVIVEQQKATISNTRV